MKSRMRDRITVNQQEAYMKIMGRFINNLNRRETMVIF